jgi:hypothetical protein
MSKKLIAVASAAALALTALVGVTPAMANTATVSVTSTSGGGASPGTQLAPMFQNVPFDNTLAGEGSAALAFTNTADGDVITITTSGKVKITAAETAGSADLNVTTLGTQNFTATATTTSFNAYAYTTDEVTTAINWSVRRPATGATVTGTIWIKGVDAGVSEAHTLEVLQAPTSLARGATAEVRVLIKDVFGNPIEATISAAEVTGASSTQSLVWDAVNKWHDATITSSTDRTFVLTFDANGTANLDSLLNTVGFAANAASTVRIVNGTPQAAVDAQVAALTAQVAALTADYNKLAKRWNKKNKNNSAPRKNVALK